MRRLVRLTLLIGAFLAGAWVQNRQAVDSCLERGGRWEGTRGALATGFCVGVPAG